MKFVKSALAAAMTLSLVLSTACTTKPVHPREPSNVDYTKTELNLPEYLPPVLQRQLFDQVIRNTTTVIAYRPRGSDIDATLANQIFAIHGDAIAQPYESLQHVTLGAAGAAAVATVFMASHRSSQISGNVPMNAKYDSFIRNVVRLDGSALAVLVAGSVGLGSATRTDRKDPIDREILLKSGPFARNMNQVAYGFGTLAAMSENQRETFKEALKREIFSQATFDDLKSIDLVQVAEKENLIDRKMAETIYEISKAAAKTDEQLSKNARNNEPRTRQFTTSGAFKAVARYNELLKDYAKTFRDRMDGDELAKADKVIAENNALLERCLSVDQGKQ